LAQHSIIERHPNSSNNNHNHNHNTDAKEGGHSNGQVPTANVIKTLLLCNSQMGQISYIT
jgi:hypothetical protein